MPDSCQYSKQWGFALLPLVILAATIAVVYLASQGLIKVPTTRKAAEPKVELQTQYKNPFDKQAQYVNPFTSYKNPFDNLR